MIKDYKYGMIRSLLRAPPEFNILNGSFLKRIVLNVIEILSYITLIEESTIKHKHIPFHKRLQKASSFKQKQLQNDNYTNERD